MNPVAAAQACVGALVTGSLRSAVVLLAAWGAATLLRRSSAAARHRAWTLGVAAALVVPWAGLASPVLPSLSSPVAGDLLSALPSTVTAPAAHAALATLAPPGALDDGRVAMGFLLVWAVGATLVGARVLRGQLQAMRLLRSARPSARLPVDGRTPILLCDSIRAPLTLGVLSPRILLPVAAEGWSEGRLRAVLLHEEAHVRRRDTLVQLAAQVVCALSWWNPLAWLAASRLRLEREHACDDAVLEAGVRPSSYASDLLAVARDLSAPAPSVAACMAAPGSTEARLQRILDPSAPRRPVRRRHQLLSVALASAVALPVACAPAPRLEGPTALVTLTAATIELPSDFRAPMRLPGTEADLVPIQAELRRRLPDLQACYQRRSAVRPGLQGEIVYHWSMSATGAFEEGCITSDTVGDEELMTCVSELIWAGPFPPSADGSFGASATFTFGGMTVGVR